MKIKLFILLSLFIIPVLVFAKKWETLENCKLKNNSFNDGDSFHVSHKGKEYIFRLYFVDTPETDNQYPKRVKEQSKYWKISKKETIKLGKKAKKITKNLLNKKFTVFTCWKDARGSSKKSRYFAFVKTSSGDDLAELLVSNGMVRIYGMWANHPKGLNSTKFKKNLEKIEKIAKKNKLGGWGKRQ